MERDEEFFERLRDIFPMVQVEQKGTKFTFFGPEEKKADCMRYIQRHLDHNMGLKGVRFRDEAAEIIKNLKSKNPSKASTSVRSQPRRIVKLIESEPPDDDYRNLNTKVERIQKRLEEKEKELKEAIRKLTAEKNNVELELMKKNEEVEKLKTSTETMSQEVDELKKKIEDLEKKNEETEKEKKNIESQLRHQEEHMKVVKKIKQEKFQCTCASDLEKKRENEKKVRDMEEKYNAQKTMLRKKDKEIRDQIMEIEKLKKLLLKKKYPEYIEVSEDEVD